MVTVTSHHYQSLVLTNKQQYIMNTVITPCASSVCSILELACEDMLDGE